MAMRGWSLAGWRRRSRGSAGLYLSSKRLALVKLAVSVDQQKVADFVDESLVEREPAEALAQAVRKLGLRGADCAWTLGFGTYSLIQLEKPNVPADELLAAVRWKVRDNLGFPLEDAVIDAFEIPGLESRGRPPALLVAAARRSELKQRLDWIKEAGLKPSRIGIGELALRNLVAQFVPDNESVAVLAIGGSLGCLAVLREKTLFVSRKLEIDASDARALTAGDEGESARERLFERIALEVQRTLDYFDSTYQRAPVRKILVVPDSVGFDLLPAALRANLGVEAQPADLAQALGVQVDAYGETAALALAAAGALDQDRWEAAAA